MSTALKAVKMYCTETCPYCIRAKAMLRHLGQPAGRCRPPMDADPPWLADAAAEVHANLIAARG